MKKSPAKQFSDWYSFLQSFCFWLLKKKQNHTQSARSFVFNSKMALLLFPFSSPPHPHFSLTTKSQSLSLLSLSYFPFLSVSLQPPLNHDWEGDLCEDDESVGEEKVYCRRHGGWTVHQEESGSRRASQSLQHLRLVHFQSDLQTRQESRSSIEAEKDGSCRISIWHWFSIWWSQDVWSLCHRHLRVSPSNGGEQSLCLV